MPLFAFQIDLTFFLLCVMPVVLSQCSPCWWGWGTTGEQSPLHGNSAAGQIWGELRNSKGSNKGEFGIYFLILPLLSEQSVSPVGFLPSDYVKGLKGC